MVQPFAHFTLETAVSNEAQVVRADPSDNRKRDKSEKDVWAKSFRREMLDSVNQEWTA